MTTPTPASFADSNIVLYALTPGPKHERAWEVVTSGVVISVQVLNEVANVSRRKRRMPWQDIRQDLASLRRIVSVIPLTTELHDAGMALAQRYQLSLYDAMIAAAAVDAGCDILWSEDMQHRMVLDGSLTVRNPFVPDPHGTA